MNTINTCYQMPPEAYRQWALQQESYEAGHLASPDGSLESIALHAKAADTESTIPEIVRLMGLDQQVATALFKILSGSPKESRQMMGLGEMGDLKEARSKTDHPDIQEAIDLLINELEMRNFVQGQRGSLVAA